MIEVSVPSFVRLDDGRTATFWLLPVEARKLEYDHPLIPKEKKEVNQHESL